MESRSNTRDVALASLCQAVETMMRQHPDARVRAVVLMVDEPGASAEPVVAPVPVYVDVFETAHSQDSGYGYGV